MFFVLFISATLRRLSRLYYVALWLSREMWIDSHFHPTLFAQSISATRLTKQLAGGWLMSTQMQEWSANMSLQADLSTMATGFYAGVGVHPWFVDAQVDWCLLEQLLSTHPQLALGEIGLDGLRPNVALQSRHFQQQLDLALAFNRPVSLHLVKDNEQGYLAVKSRLGLYGVVHAFAGSLQQAQHWQALGFYLGIGPRFLQQMSVKKIQLLRHLNPALILLESDAASLFNPKEQVLSDVLNALAQPLATTLEMSVFDLQQQLQANWKNLWSRVNE